MNIFWMILAVLAGAYGLLMGYMYVNQSRFLYYPHFPGRMVESTPAAVGLDFETVRLITEDGVTLEGWYVPSDESPYVVILFRGNAGNISHRLDSLRQLHALGLSTLIFDYRGYGRSEGQPSENGTYADALAAWRYLTEKRAIPADRIVLLGRSLGAAIATHLASRQRPAALVIESTFTSLPDLAARVYWFIPARWLMRYQYPVIRLLQTVTCPVLVVHSRDDELIPIEHGKKLFRAANEPKSFLEIIGNHDEGHLDAGEAYVSGLARFLAEHLPGYQRPGE